MPQQDGAKHSNIIKEASPVTSRGICEEFKMDEAIVAFSRRGMLSEKVRARDIKSREFARKLFPLVTAEQPHRLVTFVKGTFDEFGNCLRRSHFRRLPNTSRQTLRAQIEEEERNYVKERTESREHEKAKLLIADELRRRLESGKGLYWSFLDSARSDFPLKGNLLLGANEISTELEVQTPFSRRYRLDVGVLGPAIKKKRQLLGGIEIERSHAFEGYKGLISKTLAFPMISIDIAGLTLADLTATWASSIIEATTQDDELGRRKSFVYLHDLVYPQFIQIPLTIMRHQRHQFLVFAADEELNLLERTLKELARATGYGDTEVAVSKLSGKSKQSNEILKKAGMVVGSDWTHLNDHQCLRASVDRPKDTDDLRAHQFHTAMARILLTRANALVGYRYSNGIENENTEQDIWHFEKWIGRDKPPMIYRILPKRVAEPMDSILRFLDT